LKRAPRTGYAHASCAPRDRSRSRAAANLRIRRVFRTPREIYRLEFNIPDREYQRTTLLDRDALEELLEVDEVRAIIGANVLEA
jgi:hypothetical protein